MGAEEIFNGIVCCAGPVIAMGSAYLLHRKLLHGVHEAYPGLGDENYGVPSRGEGKSRPRYDRDDAPAGDMMSVNDWVAIVGRANPSLAAAAKMVAAGVSDAEINIRTGKVFDPGDSGRSTSYLGKVKPSPTGGGRAYVGGAETRFIGPEPVTIREDGAVYYRPGVVPEKGKDVKHDVHHLRDVNSEPKKGPWIRITS